MTTGPTPPARAAAAVLAVAVALAGGCASRKVIVPAEGMPRELNKVTMPEYMIEPPDVIQLDLLTAVPKPPYKLQPLDTLAIRVPGALPESPIAGVFPIDPDGTVNLGGVYGSVPVAGLTVTDARAAIEARLKSSLADPTADVNLAQGRAVQQVRGPHLVRPDGTIGLGTYGSVRVVGQTLPQARRTVEAHLGQFFQNPEVSIDVSGFNSKVYYLIFDAGLGQTIVRQPVTGNETVLDAVSQAGGLSTAADTKRIWVSRPTPGDGCTEQTLPVDWKALTEAGDTRTNYQLMAGDRVFVKAARAVTIEARLARVLAPIERALGATLLGVGVARTFQDFDNNRGVGNGFNNGIGFVP